MTQKKPMMYPSVFPDDAAAKARIYTKEDGILLVKQSKAEGKEVYQPRTFIEIQVKGSADSVDRPLQEKDIERFPDAWDAYKHGDVEQPDGTPLNAIEGMEAGYIVALNSRGIYSLEDLISIEPEQVQGIRMGLRQLQAKAKKHLGVDDLTNTALVVTAEQKKLQAENDELKARLDKLEALLNAATEPREQSKPTKATKVKADDAS